MSLVDLPSDLLILISARMEPSDIRSLVLTCKTMAMLYKMEKEFMLGLDYAVKCVNVDVYNYYLNMHGTDKVLLRSLQVRGGLMCFKYIIDRFDIPADYTVNGVEIIKYCCDGQVFTYLLSEVDLTSDKYAKLHEWLFANYAYECLNILMKHTDI